MNILVKQSIRATLAIGSLAATVYFIVAGIDIMDAWWVIVTGLSLFYVEGQVK